MERKENNKEVDLSLVRRAKKGDYRAFDLLVLKYQSRVISTAFKYVKEKQLAEDIAQEAFIKSYKSINSFREESSFYTWIYRITVNTAKNYLVSRKRKGETSMTDLSEDDSVYFDKVDMDSPQEILNANQLRDLIHDTLSSLGEETRTALSLREFDGLSYEKIAEIVDCPVGTVRSRIFRGREVLEQSIKKHMRNNQVYKNNEIS
ncbi:MAG: RNA polymerase sigma factor RpoE [Gammaproteobacteria bacterium]|mgnify:CR=1 FL=1|nr:RNA polymerase sigma factor RpoE [Gammaproteobacteria bacterium]HJL96442.1 sigma-70 family RNA polymerase sigma factor [SAR86 cluster bacterium]